MSKVCSKCGMDNANANKYCLWCGKKFSFKGRYK